MRFVPGIVLALLVAVVARAATAVLDVPFDEVLVAIVLGIALANLIPLPATYSPGLRLASQRVLRVGVALLGARLSLDAVLAIGLGAVGLVVAAMVVALGVALLMGRALGVPRRLALLIGVGTAVCGNSAIAATAPLLKAEHREVAFAVATITLFGTLAVFVFPLIGISLGLADVVFGLWVGVAVNDTSQVVAAGTAYSVVARDVATVVKLMRNALMAPLIVLIAWWWRVREPSGAVVGQSLRSAVPLFVVGFLALALLRTQGAITPEQASVLGEAAKGLILIALAGIGLQTRFGDLRSIGPGPFVAGLTAAAVLAMLTLAVITGLGLAPLL